MDGLTIAIIAAVVVVLVSLVFGFLYVKKKIRNKLITEGVKIINQTAEKHLDKKTAGHVGEVTSVAARVLGVKKKK